MPSIASLLASIPDDFKPMAAIGIGAVILVCLAMFHGVGVHHILLVTRRGERRLRMGRPHLMSARVLFGWSIFLMLALHVAEIIFWSFSLTHMGLIARVHDSIYFCANAYTTLGYGAIALEDPWRNISPIIAISGLFTFAWTTSTLVDVVRGHAALIDQLAQERERQLALRQQLRKNEWAAVKKARQEERSEEADVRSHEQGASLIEHLGMWREERKQASEIRKARAQEIERLRRKEDEDEEKLGPGNPPV